MSRNEICETNNAPQTKQETATYEPVLMRASTAAAYFDMSEDSFRRAVSINALPKPIKITERIYRWRKMDLDAWLRQFDNVFSNTEPEGNEWALALAA